MKEQQSRCLNVSMFKVGERHSMSSIPPPVLPAEDQRKQGMRNRKKSDEMESEGGGVEEEHWFVYKKK